MRGLAQGFLAGLSVTTIVSIAQGDGYPDATLDLATYETICDLRIEPFQGLDEAGVQSRYEWAVEMAKLCLANPEKLPAEHRASFPIEFQRHAGRTARYRGFGEQAIEDYQTAIEYAYQVADLLSSGSGGPESWEHTILQDVADTYLAMGAYEAAAELSHLLIETDPVGGKFGHATQYNRLARIAQRQGHYADSVRFQMQALQDQLAAPAYVEHFPELDGDDPSGAWSRAVRQAEVRRAIEADHRADQVDLTKLREAYCAMARALRLNGQWDDAAYALETAALTPWTAARTYRQNLDLNVERERAFLALGQGEAKEAIRYGQECLSLYASSIHPAERVELLELLSRAMEGLGDLRGAMDKLREAIAVVESGRANLVLDENKQSFVASYAPLYRRALELVIRSNANAGAEAIGESFEWSERVKARAMLDSLNRYGRDMAAAVALGDPAAIQHVRDLCGKMVSIADLRQSPWWPAETALLEYTYTDQNAFAGQPAGPGAVYLWVITGQRVSFHRLKTRPAEVDRNCAALAKAVAPGSRGDASWVEPARWLYEHTVAPAKAELKGVKRLIIVGDGKLSTAPFEAFVVARNANPERHLKHRLLIEDFTVAYAPSATLLDTVSRRPRPESWTSDLWAFASTQFKDSNAPPKAEPEPASRPYKAIVQAARSSPLDDLPYAAREVRGLEKWFDSAAVKVFVDEPNMKAKLLTASEGGELRAVRFLHFATHAVNEPDRPFLSGLMLCPPYPDGSDAAPVRPVVDARREPTGDPAVAGNNQKIATTKPTDTPWRRKFHRPERLTVSELADLDLRSDLVVLSACHSLGDTPIDGDWLNGLTRAFLIAGSSGVLCTTSDMPDLEALSVVSALYYALLAENDALGRAIDVPKALQQVKVDRLGSPKYAHPSRWASWVYHGCVPQD